MSWSPRSNSHPIVTLTCHCVKWSVLLLFHHTPHINRTAGGWSGRREKEGRKVSQKKGGEREQVQIDRMVARSVIVILDGWMNVFDVYCRFRGTVSETKRNWFGPRGKESMCEGHVSASLLFCVETWRDCPKCSNYWDNLLKFFYCFYWGFFCLFSFNEKIVTSNQNLLYVDTEPIENKVIPGI